jgi:hypothetical protein
LKQACLFVLSVPAGWQVLGGVAAAVPGSPGGEVDQVGADGGAAPAKSSQLAARCRGSLTSVKELTAAIGTFTGSKRPRHPFRRDQGRRRDPRQHQMRED